MVNLLGKAIYQMQSFINILLIPLREELQWHPLLLLVIPAEEAGSRGVKSLDSRFRGNDNPGGYRTVKKDSNS
jgi:hypothetical protein